MDHFSGIFGWVPALGVVVLGAAFAFAMWRNRQHSAPHEIERTERATKAARDASDRETES